MTLKAGTYFVAGITFGQAGQSPMTSVLALDASNTSADQHPLVRLYARVIKKHKPDDSSGSKEEGGQGTPLASKKDDISVDKAADGSKEDQTEYGIDIRNLQIFKGAVRLDGTGRYYPDAKKLSVTADLLIQLAEQQAVKFNVTLTMDKESTAFKVGLQSAGTGSITNPFGGMFNVKLESLRIEGSSTRKAGAPKGIERKCTIYGSALLGENSTSRLLGLIHFEDGSPVVGVVDFTRKIKDSPPSTDSTQPAIGAVPSNAFAVTDIRTTPVKMTDIYSQVIRPNPGSDTPGSWPSDWDDFELLEAYMSYNRSGHSVTVDNRTYSDGFWIYGSFALFQIPISTSLEIKSQRKGFVLTGSINTVIDLGIIQFTKYTSSSENYPGLSLKIDTTQSSGVSKSAAKNVK